MYYRNKIFICWTFFFFKIKICLLKYKFWLWMKSNKLKRTKSDTCFENHSNPSILPFQSFDIFSCLFEIIRIYGDGICFYRAFLHTILGKSPTNIHVFNLRNMVAKHLENNFAKYQDFLAKWKILNFLQKIIWKK